MVEVQNAQRFSMVSLFRITSTVETATKPAGVNLFAGAMVCAPSAGLKDTMSKIYFNSP
jgi:hypothetical protein